MMGTQWQESGHVQEGGDWHGLVPIIEELYQDHGKDIATNKGEQLQEEECPSVECFQQIWDQTSYDSTPIKEELWPWTQHGFMGLDTHSGDSF